MRAGLIRLGVVGAAVAALAGCTAAPAATQAESTAPHAGRYPVAIAQGAVTRTASVRAGGYALVAAGDPVVVHLPQADLRVIVAGPDVDVPTPRPGEPIRGESAEGVLTLTVQAIRGRAVISLDQFLGLNEDQARFSLGADRRSGVATPGHPVTLHLHARFATGHTTLTWQPLGKPLVTWDFVIEID